MARVPVLLLSLTGAAFAAMLVVTGLLGQYVRPTSDDWCLAMKERDWGVRRIVHEYYFHLNGRLANAFMSGVVYIGGGWITKVFPTLLYAGLAIGTGWLVYLALVRVAARPRAVSLAAAAATGLGVAMITAWGAHSPYAVVYWAAGTISHTLPSVLTVLVVAAALTWRGPWVVWATVFFVLGFVDATLSETFVFTCGTILALLLVYHLLFGPRLGRTVRLTSAGLLGLLVGIVVLYTSPGAVARRNSLHNSSLSLRHAVHRAVDVFPHVLRLSYSAHVLVPAIGLGLLLALLAPGLSVSRRAFTWIVPSCVVLPFVMTFEVLVLLGMAYGRNGWAYSRVWQDFLIPATLAIVFGTYLIAGAVLARVRLNPAAVSLAALVPLAAVAYGVVAHADTARSLRKQMVSRANAWDSETATIKAQAAQGVTIATYRPLHIAGLAEPFTRKPWARDEIGQCAATYLHVDMLVPPPFPGAGP